MLKPDSITRNINNRGLIVNIANFAEEKSRLAFTILLNETFV